MSYTLTPKDFLLEVRKGNVPGHEIVGLQASHTDTGTSYEDMWGGDADYVFPTAAESWEILRADAADDTAGTGARTIAIQSLDANYDEQITFVTLTGATTVVTGTHIRAKFAFVFDSGSGNTNAGKLIIQVAGGGAQRQVIMPGIGNSQDGFYTCPAGFSAFAIQYIPFFPFNESGSIRVKLFPDTLLNDSFIIASEFPFYQSGLVIPVAAPFDMTEKTDMVLQAKSTNISVEVKLELDLLLVDNQYVGQGA
jgi:hypothetical protein